MNNNIIKNIWRFFFLVLLQVLIFRQIVPSGTFFFYVSIMIYPIFVMLLPFNIQHWVMVCFGFLLGISIDIFYDSPGVHASATVFLAFIRPTVLKFVEPRGGYNITQIPAKSYLGANWFLSYAALMILLHHLFYFSVEAFTFVYITQIIIKTILSFIFSMIFVMIYQFIFDPKGEL